jgi:hypothetical protein
LRPHTVSGQPQHHLQAQANTSTTPPRTRPLALSSLMREGPPPQRPRCESVQALGDTNPIDGCMRVPSDGRDTDGTAAPRRGSSAIAQVRAHRLSISEWSVKPSAQPTLVRIQHLPPRAKTPSDLYGRGTRRACPRCSRVPPWAAVCGSSRDIRGMILSPVTERFIDPFVDRRDLPINALSVDAKQDLHTVACPGSNLRGGHTRVKPQ